MVDIVDSKEADRLIREHKARMRKEFLGETGVDQGRESLKNFPRHPNCKNCRKLLFHDSNQVIGVCSAACFQAIVPAKNRGVHE